jgi:ankyrin repeat protein
VKHGADIELQDAECNTACDFAQQNNYAHIAHYLKHVKNMNNKLSSHLKEEDVPQLINKGAQITSIFSYLCTKHKEAILTQFPEVMYHYADENNLLQTLQKSLRIPQRWLLHATQCRDKDNVQLLLNTTHVHQKINNIRDASGNTALHIAALFRTTDIAQWLLYAGALPHMKNNKNKRPSDIAHASHNSNFSRIVSVYNNRLNTLLREKHRTETTRLAHIPEEVITYINQLTTDE